MSLPIVIIFERHWDTIPKSIIKDFLPDLYKKGYETFCFEAPQNLSSAEIINRHNSGLESDTGIQQQAENFLRQVRITSKLSDMSFSSLAELMRIYVSSNKYIYVAERIKQLPASYILKEVFDEAAKLLIDIKGIDINSEMFDEMVSVDLTKRILGINNNEDLRITTMFQNLLKLQSQQEEGIIFSCGALHAKGLMNEFMKHGLQDEVLYYFPHSSSRYDESVDDVVRNDVLSDHTYPLSQREIRPFGKKIIREITEKIRYKREIPEGNSHSQFLSNCFKANFRPFLRPGCHVDALMDISEPFDIEDIQKRISTVGIQTHNISLNDRTYLVIPNVNAIDIANRIRKIS